VSAKVWSANAKLTPKASGKQSTGKTDAETTQTNYSPRDGEQGRRGALVQKGK
jgi:hypothetical protein